MINANSHPRGGTLLALSLTGGCLLVGGWTAQAGTMAYWRFETGPADTQVVHNSGVNGVWSADVPDSSGHGNALSAWTGDAWAGYAYKTAVPAPTVPQTGAGNLYSIKNSGGYPGMWNTSLSTWTPTAWTVEASFKPETGGWRTIVGRDSRGAGTQPGADPNAAALYFQIQPDNRVAVTFQDVMGYQYSAVSAPGLIQGFQWSTDPDGLTGRWYSMAGVSDGTTLSLYLNDLATANGYQLVAQTDLAAQGSSNRALTPGVGSGGDWSAGSFTVGRGMYNGGHGDRAYGYIDEVRLTEGALAPGQFLFSVPEPAAASLLMLGGLVLFGIRLRRS